MIRALTTLADARRRVLEALNRQRDRDPLLASSIGYIAFPDSKFRSPQGAAFASAKLRRDMERAGLIRYEGNPYGYYITAKGREDLLALVSTDS